MMLVKKIGLVICFVFPLSVFAQDASGLHLYKPDADASKDIAKLISEAQAVKKNVFIQVGGNWCSWCKRFNEAITSDKQIDSLVNADYVVYHLNYSKENKNDDLLAKYGYPQRFGFPVFLILDEKGNRIHTQDSAFLEEGKGYNRDKIFEFLSNWNVKALDPKQYQEN